MHWTESEFWKKEAPLGVGEGVHPLHDHRTLAGGNTHGTHPAFRIPVIREIGIYNACQEAAKDKGLHPLWFLGVGIGIVNGIGIGFFELYWYWYC